MELAPSLVNMLGAIGVALITSWAAIATYRKNADTKVAAAEVKRWEEAAILAITQDELAAQFRKEMRDEMHRLRGEVLEKAVAYRALEEENRTLRFKIGALELEVLQLKARLTLQEAYKSDHPFKNDQQHPLHVSTTIATTPLPVVEVPPLPPTEE